MIGATTVTLLLALQAGACPVADVPKSAPVPDMQVITGSARTAARTAIIDGAEAFVLAPMRRYPVLCQTDDQYRVIEDAEKDPVVTGYVPADQVFVWPSAEGLVFSADALQPAKGGTSVPAGPQTGPADRESYLASLTRPPLLRGFPVQDAGTGPDPRRFDILVPVADADCAASGSDCRSAQALADLRRRAEAPPTILLVQDFTSGADPLMSAMAEAIEQKLVEPGGALLASARMGLILYRDHLDRPPVEYLPPIPAALMPELLRSILNLPAGGGDAAEPVLDAVYHGLSHYDWADAGPDGGGRRIMIAVLGDRAHPTTTGALDNGKRVAPPGMTATEVAHLAAAKSVPILTVRDGPAEYKYPESVLETLALVPGGAYLSSSGPRREEETAHLVVDALMARLRISPVWQDAGRWLEAAGSGLAPPALALKLRPASITLDGGLLEPAVLIEEERLSQLISIFEVHGAIAPDAETTQFAAGLVVATMAGDPLLPGQTADTLWQRAGNLKFSTPLTGKVAGWAATGKAPDAAELDEIAGQIGAAAIRLAAFHAQSREEVAQGLAVWMPLALLP